MTKQQFLTVGWNNGLTLGLGIPTLVYSGIVLATQVMSDFAGFIGLGVIGVVF